MFTLNCKGRLLVVDKPIVMGIINVTPDSFYAGSRFENIPAILKVAGQMLNEGAVILDIGGQSTRPGSAQLSLQEELDRVLPSVTAVANEFPDTYISIDTFYAAVAESAVHAGASIVNDISGGELDAGMIPTVASLHVPYVLTHMRGKPATMQHEVNYENVTREVLDFFIAKTALLKEAGITDLIIDPGFGFGKTIQHNFELLKNLSVFSMLQLPILTGLSRKATIYKTLGTDAGQSLNGTSVLHTIALLEGASILRVHDVKAACEAITLVDKFRST